jgi:DNA (cytosine-5)-methyltransferase 1
MEKINIIDLFAGCGGLTEGFEKNGHYNLLGAVEWEESPCINLINRLKTKWAIYDADQRVLRFDIQRTEELFNGWENDSKYGSHSGLDNVIGDNNVDLIIGGPPCQAYSIAGRIRDKDGMRTDYRNYLFESYLKVVKRYKPKAFIFENVQGMLSAKPGGTPVTTLIKRGINEIGYDIIDDLHKHALLDLTEYGVPQKRKRVIILGLNRSYFDDTKSVLLDFYHRILPKFKEERKKTVFDAIGDLPPFFPLEKEIKEGGKKFSHLPTRTDIPNHTPRYHNKRDISIFKKLAKDIEDGEFKYVSTDTLRKLYTELTGKTSNVHKYYVLRWDDQSNTIPAHLYKDGLRHIHPDSKQARSLTVREAARLQTFDDDYEFISSNGDNYKMIGNAVPPKFAEKLAAAVKEVLSGLKNKSNCEVIKEFSKV